MKQLQTNYNFDGLEKIFIFSAIVGLLCIAGIIFLIIYGIRKKKKAYWLTGCAILLTCLFIYLFNYFGSYNAAKAKTEELKIQNKRYN